VPVEDGGASILGAVSPRKRNGAPDPREDRERFFHVHVQKTAGTSLRRRLQHHFGERAVYPDASDGIEKVEAVISIEHLQERYRVRRDEIRLVTGHFPLCTAEILGDEFTTLAVVRDPVERTLSYLRHQRRDLPEDRDKRLDEIYDDPWRFHGVVHNHMVKMFSLTPEEATAWMMTHVEFPPERLERAKEGLASVDVLGLQERFDEFCDELSRRFGWDLGAPKSDNLGERDEVSDAFRARIAEDNAMDIELYEFARRLYEERRAPAAEARSRS
jgi:Sulfotransferase family